MKQISDRTVEHVCAIHDREWKNLREDIKKLQMWTMRSFLETYVASLPLDGAAQIARERSRQITEEGFTRADDELSMAAVCYALPPNYMLSLNTFGGLPDWRPWGSETYKC